MKLSEAIRLGSMLRPQARGWFFGGGGSCAQGAALEACGVTCAPDDFDANWKLHWEMPRLWPWADVVEAQCPACKRTGVARSMLSHLNNSEQHGDHGWTREQIADWVATIEPAEQPTPIIAEPAHVQAR